MDKEPVTPEWVAGEVAHIRECAEDPEAAHGLEDDLHKAVLYAIAEGECAGPQACAVAALKTLEVDFPRWRA